MILLPAGILANLSLVCGLLPSFLCTNRSDQARKQEPVQLTLTDEEGAALGGPGAFALFSRDQWTGLGQADDLDGDGTVDELVFLSDFGERESKRITVESRTSRSSPQVQAFSRVSQDGDRLTLAERDDLVYTISAGATLGVLARSHPNAGPMELFRLGIYRPERPRKPVFWIGGPHGHPSDWEERLAASGPVRSVVRLKGLYRCGRKDWRPIQILYLSYASKPWVECRVRAGEKGSSAVRLCAAFTREGEERFYKAGREGAALLEERPFPWLRGLVLPPLWDRGIVNPTKRQKNHLFLLGLDPAGRVVLRAMARVGEGDPAIQWERWRAELEEESASFRCPIEVERLSD